MQFFSEISNIDVFLSVSAWKVKRPFEKIKTRAAVNITGKILKTEKAEQFGKYASNARYKAIHFSLSPPSQACHLKNPFVLLSGFFGKL